MNWKQLLCTERYASNAGEYKNESYRSPFLVDIDRLIYSSHFRRLQDKTQVYPLSQSGYVRTRLTHSLEVSIVGRSLGFYIGKMVLQNESLENITKHDFGYVVQAACLAHDIGNPPFGHVGEAAITDFFTSKQDYLINKLGVSKKILDDFTHIDGNSHGFRVLTQLTGWRNKGGLRLTYATLGAFLKYPTPCIPKTKLDKIFKPTKEDANNITRNESLEALLSAKKTGILQTELSYFLELTDYLGLIKLHDDLPIYARHPLAFLTEAADDICYTITDIEDGFYVGLISLENAEELLAPIAINPKQAIDSEQQIIKILRNDTYYQSMDSLKKIEWLRGKATHNLIMSVVEVFKNNQDKLMQGAFNSGLLEKTEFHNNIMKCKQYIKDNIFSSVDKSISEISGITAIRHILEELYQAIIAPFDTRSQAIFNTLRHKLPTHYFIFAHEDWDAPQILAYNLTKTIDMISELTDSNLIKLHKIFQGIQSQ